MTVSKSNKRRLLFRVSAVAFGLFLFAFAECLCRLLKIDVRGDTTLVDPGFSRLNPLFALDPDGERYAIRESRLKFFVPESFPATKPSGTFRIFCLGGSTVQGRPYSKETAFSAWLELSLKAADPSRNWEVINCGGVSYASYRLKPILKECLQYEPDLFVLCTGHNEFLEERSYSNLRRVPEWLFSVSDAASQLRVTRLLHHGFSRVVQWGRGSGVSNFSQYSPEVDAFLDYRDGLKAYVRDPVLRRGVIAEFAANVREMIVASHGAGVPLLLVSPPANLRNTAPFKSQHRDPFGGADAMRFGGILEEASKQARGDPMRNVSLLKEAVAIDPQYAATYYDLGKCYETLGMPALAKTAFNRALDLDVCPLRILEPMRKALRTIAAETSTPLIDAHALLESRSQWGILGSDWLVDHVHPSLQGHQLIATELLNAMVRLGWVRGVSGWETQRDTFFQKQLASLDPLYFVHGQQRLRNLQFWTEGRADGPPIEERETRWSRAAAFRDGTNVSGRSDRTESFSEHDRAR